MSESLTKPIPVAAVQAAVQGAVELLVFLPLALAVAALVYPDGHVWPWLCSLPLGYAFGCLMQRALRLRKFYQLLPFMLLFGWAHAYVTGEGGLFVYAAMPVGLIAVYRGARYTSADWLLLFPVGYYIFGLIGYFAASVILVYFVPSHPYLQVVKWCGFAAGALTLFVANRSSIRQESRGSGRGPMLAPAVIRNNRALIVMLLAVIVVIAAFPVLQQAAGWLKQQIVHFIGWLLAGDGVPNQEGGRQPVSPPAFQGMEEGGQPSPFWIWLENAAIVLTYIFAGLFIIMAIVIAARKLPAIIRHLLRLLASILELSFGADSNAGYRDDIESLVDWNDWKERLRAGLHDLAGRWRVKGERWDEMTDNRERIRFLYRKLLDYARTQGRAPESHMTPREVGHHMSRTTGKPVDVPESLIPLYEKARYTEKRLDESEEEISRLKAEVDRLVR